MESKTEQVSNNEILIGIENNNLFIKATGHMTAQNCFALKNNFYNKIEEGSLTFNIYIDMSKIEYIDSTFLGFLIGLEKRLYKNFNNHLYIINPSKQAMEHLDCFTISIFLKIIDKMNIPDNLNFTKLNNTCELGELDKLNILLCSHEDLSSISNDNKEKFKSFQEFLKNQIEEKSSDY